MGRLFLDLTLAEREKPIWGSVETKSQHYYCSLYRGTASFANSTFHPRLLRHGSGPWPSLSFGPPFRTSDFAPTLDQPRLLWRTSALSFGPRFRASDRISGSNKTGFWKPPKVEDCKVARWGDFFLGLTLAEREMLARNEVRKYAALLLLLI